MAAWTSTNSTGVETLAPVDGANIGLVTRFGSDASVLRPFEDLPRARKRPKRAGGARLGELLLAHDLLTEEELAEALAEQRKGRPKLQLGEILLRRGVVSAPTLVRLLAAQCQLDLEEEKGFGTGLRRAIELRHREDRVEPEPEPVQEWAPEPALEPVVAEELPAPKPAKRLGELLVDKGLLNGLQLDHALAEQEDTGRLLGEVVVDLGYVPMITLVNVLTEQLNGELEQQSGFGTGLRHMLETQLLQQREEAA
jgi:type IV pilus assembly protein PilB